MGRALSMDLRERVVAAIGSWMSRRAAALRFGIGAATAVRWAGLMRDRGSAAPRRQGGDMRSGRTAAHAARISRGARRSARRPMRRSPNCAPRSRVKACRWRSRRCGASSRATRSRVKKDRPRRRAGPPRRAETARGLVRGPARPRSRHPRLRRRDRCQHQDGTQTRALRARRQGCAWRSRTGTGTGTQPPSSAASGSRA